MDINVRLEAEQIRLEVRDDGRGIPRKQLKGLIEGVAEAGVGIAGMRERVRELGGSLQIESDKKGTLLRVTIPISQTTQKSVDGDSTN